MITQFCLLFIGIFLCVDTYADTTPKLPDDIRVFLKNQGRLVSGGPNDIMVSVKQVISNDREGRELSVLIGYSSATLNRAADVYFLIRRTNGEIVIVEDTQLEGASLQDLSEIKKVICREVHSNTALFIESLKQTEKGIFHAMYVTDRRPMCGAGAEVELRRNPDGTFKVVRVAGFKK